MKAIPAWRGRQRYSVHRRQSLVSIHIDFRDERNMALEIDVEEKAISGFERPFFALEKRRRSEDSFVRSQRATRSCPRDEAADLDRATIAKMFDGRMRVTSGMNASLCCALVCVARENNISRSGLIWIKRELEQALLASDARELLRA
jgi:hypothetical protein